MAIPPSLAPFFQEYDFEDLDPEKDSGAILERTLQFGNREELRWLFSVYPKTQIRAWVEEFGNYRLPEPHFTFWRLMLDTSK